MSYPVIRREDVRVGDLIRCHFKDIVFEGKVHDLSNGYAYTAQDLDLNLEVSEKVELVERPAPVLPTVPGSLIRIEHIVTRAARNAFLDYTLSWTDEFAEAVDSETLQGINHIITVIHDAGATA